MADIRIIKVGGSPYEMGLSENGVAIVINRLTASDGRPGIPFPVIARSILQAPNTSKALDTVLRSR